MATDNPTTPTEGAVLEFENARALQALYAGDEKLLKELEAELGVRVVARDSVLRVEGEPRQVERVRQLFAELDDARKRGLAIRRHEFEYALRNVAGGEKKNLSRLLDHKIVCSPRKPPVVPKTEGQSAYVEMIRAHDITFGIGPAGTGKTISPSRWPSPLSNRKKSAASFSPVPRSRPARRSASCPATFRKSSFPTCVRSMTRSMT
jgi:phosphate starvation-inducible PhoH-like protein